MSSAEGKAVIRQYNKISYVLVEFEVVYHTAWVREVSQLQYGVYKKRSDAMEGVLGDFEWSHGSGELLHPFDTILWWLDLDLGMIQLFFLQLLIIFWFCKQKLPSP